MILSNQPTNKIPGMRIQEGNETFKPPPLDGSLNPAELIDFEIKHSPSWIFAKWQTQSGSIRELTFSEFGRAVHQCARDVSKHLSIDIEAGELPPLTPIGASGAQSRPVFALFNAGEPLRYFAISWGIMRAGAVPFPISTNNSKEALIHLLKSSGARFVVEGPRGSSPELEKTLSSALQELEPSQAIRRVPFPSMGHLFDVGSSFKPLPPAPKRGWEEDCLLLHSSGSTNFPKKIAYSVYTYLSVFRSILFGDESATGWCVFTGGLPPFHAFSFQWSLAMALGSGLTLGLRDPNADTFKPSTPQALLREVKTLNCDVLLAVPSFYRIYSQDSSAIEQLRSLKSAVTGGGPLPLETAAILKKAEVPLQTLLGSTECAVISKYPTSHPDSLRFEQNPQVNLILRRQSDTELTGQYELLIGKNNHYSPNVFNDTFEGQEVFASGDLVIVTKGKDGRELLQIVGRLDDQIMHSNGEKTNPGPLQEILELNPLISAALYFGRERNQVGVLIELAIGNEIDSRDENAVAALRNTIWPTVKKANEFAPSHSAVSKEMIIFSSVSKPFTRTAKGSIRRGAVLKEYQEEIDQAYKAVNDLAETRVQAPSTWTKESALSFVSSVVEETLDRSGLDFGADLFSQGLNSLSATRIRTILSRSVEKDTRLSSEIVYLNPTISSLASALLASINGKDLGAASMKSHVEAMRSMIQTYSSNWPFRSIKITERPQKEVVLLTGSTGGLGSTLLSQLLQTDSVSTIYALNRPSTSKSLKERQVDSFVDKGMDTSLLESDKLHLVEARLDQENLGLEAAEYERIRESITLLVHNAWRLDFNLSLSSFEEHVKGSRNLIDLALQSPRVDPPKFVFTSSIASVGNYQVEGKRVPEVDFLDELEVSVGGGYGESKAVTERILANASLQTGIETCSVRIGQITSSAWSTTDWLPLMIQSAQVLNSLPDVPNDSPITWIRSEDVGSSILDFAFSKSSGDTTPSSSSTHETYHVVHPNPISWSWVFSIFSRELRVPLVSYSDWFEKLETSEASLETLPAKKLSDFFRRASESPPMKTNTFDGSTEALGLKRLDTNRAQRASRSLREAGKLSESDAREWLKYWRSKGFVNI